MADLKDILSNIEQIYSSNNSFNILKDFERVIDELDVYVFENWIDGELVAGPKETRYFVECTFMWPKDKMPEPAGAKRLLEYGCKVKVAESRYNEVRKIKTPDDIRPGTRKGKIDTKPIWLIKVMMPKKLMSDVNRGYKELDRYRVEDVLSRKSTAIPEPVDQQAAAPEAPAQ